MFSGRYTYTRKIVVHATIAGGVISMEDGQKRHFPQRNTASERVPNERL